MLGKEPKFYSYIFPVIIIVLAFIFFLPSLNFDFVWDDKELYINPKNIPLDKPFAKLGENFIPKQDKMYIPITYFIWSVVAALGGIQNGNYNPYAFHLLNLLVHILNGLLVFFILKKLFNSNFNSLFGALMFTLHPIQIESVAWISEARGLLSAFFGFLSILLFMQFQKNSFIKIFSVSFLLFLSILSKPSGIVFPFLLILVDWFVNDKFRLSDLLKRNFYYLLIIVPFVFISFQGEATKTIEFEIPLIFRPFVWFMAIGFYFFKIILPFDYSPGYGLSYSFLKTNPGYFLYSIFTISLIIIGFVFKTFKREYWFGLLFFIIAFLPVSNLLSFYYQYWSVVSDRYVYVSLFGFAYLVPNLVNKYLPKFRYFALSSLLILFFIISRTELSKWKDEFSLWNSCIERYPDRIPQVYLGRGMAFESRGEIYQALKDYAKSVEIDSNFFYGYYNRGNIFYDLKLFDKAIADFSRTIELNPKFVNAYVNRGLCHLELQEYDKALSDFNKALELDTFQIDVYLFLGQAFEGRREFQNAIQAYQKAISLGYSDKDVIQKIENLRKLGN